MPFETINMEEITEARRKAIAGSIRTISLEELKALGERLFPAVDHPWLVGISMVVLGLILVSITMALGG